MAAEAAGREFADWIRALAIAWKTLISYPPGHPALDQAFQRAYEILTRLLGPSGALTIGVSGEKLVFEGTEYDSPAAHRFATTLYRRNVAVVTFSEGLDARELETFLRLLAPDPRRQLQTPLDEQLRQAGITHIDLKPVDYSAVVATQESTEPGADPQNLWEALLGELIAGGPSGLPGLEGGSEVLEESRGEGHPGNKLLALLTRLLREQDVGQREADPGGGGELTEGGTVFSRAVASRLAQVHGLSVQKLALQVTMLLRRLPVDVRAVVLDSALRVIAPDDQSGPALETLHRALADAEILASLRRLQAEGVRFSKHASRLLQSLSEMVHAAEERGGEETVEDQPLTAEREKELLATLREIFREVDIDRWQLGEADRRHHTMVLDLPLRTVPERSSIEDPEGRTASGLKAEALAEIERPELTLPLAETMLELLITGTTGESEAARLAHRLQASLGSLIANARLQRAVPLVERMRQMEEDPAYPRPRRQVVADSLASLVSSEALEDLLRSLPEGTEPALLRRLVQALGRDAIRRLLEALSEEEDRSRRRKLLDALSALGPEVVPEAIRLLSDERWFVVRNMILLLRSIDDRSTLPEIRRHTAHPHPRVRLEAIRTLASHPEELSESLLKRAIDDPDPKLAEAAIVLIGSHRLREGVGPLVQILSNRRGLLARRRVRGQALRALGEVGAPAALESLAPVFRGWALTPWRREERRLAYETLTGYPEAARRELVDRGLRSWDRGVRATCKRLLATSPPGNPNERPTGGPSAGRGDDA